MAILVQPIDKFTYSCITYKVIDKVKAAGLDFSYLNKYNHSNFI